MLEQADSVNEDGKIDFEEFAAIWQRKLLTQNDSYIKAVFKVLGKLILNKKVLLQSVIVVYYSILPPPRTDGWQGDIFDPTVRP